MIIVMIFPGFLLLFGGFADYSFGDLLDFGCFSYYVVCAFFVSVALSLCSSAITTRYGNDVGIYSFRKRREISYTDNKCVPFGWSRSAIKSMCVIYDATHTE